MSKRTVLLGIDGASFNIIRPLLKRHQLPNFEKIINNGYTANLLAPIPPSTIPSWPCLLSGMTPQQLGFPYFYSKNKGLFNSKVWKEKAIFSNKNFKSLVLKIPGTYPAWPINGMMISGILAPKISCYPKELIFEIAEDWVTEHKNISDVFDDFLISKKFFMKKYPNDFDLSIFYSNIPDALSHLAKKSSNKTLKLISYGYELLDDFLGELLALNNFDNLMIFSDHGLGYYKKEFNLKRWLEKKNLLFINELKRKKYESILLKIYGYLRPYVKFTPINSLVNKFKNLEKEVNQNEKRSNETSQNMGSKKNLKSRVVYDFSNVNGLYLDTLNKSIKLKIKKELGKDPRIKSVKLCKKFGFPDLYIIFKNKFIASKNPSFFVIRNRDTINHTQYGVFMAYGNDIKKGKRTLVDYKDVAPTILKLYEIEPKPFMKGTPLNIFLD